ncbi:MAG TPA: mannosyltransferase family protein [Vicinamibacterales bacterium]|nr:mannosyltransferase family protein [Vicinamibacterales bacterium]
MGLAALALVPLSSRHLDLLPGFPALEIWAQWDAEHYVSIAANGYDAPTDSFSNITFFPLYPWLMRLLALPFGSVTEQSAALAGLLISNVSLFVALVYLVALVTRDLEASTARRTVLYVLVFPTTMFLSSVYAESLFLATAVACIYHARRGEWYRAGLAGGLGALTRPFGILLAAPMLVELVRQRAPARAWPPILLVPAGLAVFFGFLWWQFGDPLAYLVAGRGWGRGFHFPWETLAGYIRGPIVAFDWPYSWLDLVSMALMFVVVIAGWRALPRSYSAYALAAVAFALCTGTAWFSASRHALAVFPIIISLAVFGGRSRAFNAVWLVLSVLLALAFIAREAVGYWVA